MCVPACLNECSVCGGLRYRILWNWSYRQLEAAVGTELWTLKEW